MSAKSANLYAQIDPDIKKKAEKILEALGIPASNAISMFYRQIILQNGLPFDIKLPQDFIIGVTVEEQSAQIATGYDDFLNGDVVPAKDAFANIRKQTGI